MSNELLNLCPVWNVPCLRENCISYEVHTKHRFWNLKTHQYIPLDQLEYYKQLPEPERDETVERRITIIRECRQLGKIIEIEEKTDHLIPST